MNVSLTNELEEYVEYKVASGLYGSASEVVRDALRLMEERDRLLDARLDALREELRKGVTQLRGGRSKSLDPDAVRSIKAAGKRRLRSQRGKNRA